MRIAFFHNVPSGGAKRVVYEQVKAFAKQHEVTLIQFPNKKKDFLDFSKLPIDLIEYNAASVSFLEKIGRAGVDLHELIWLRTIHSKIAADIDKHKFDCIIVHPDKLTQAPFLLRFLKTPSIYYCEEWLRIVYEKEFESTQKHDWLRMRYEQTVRRLRKRIDRRNARKATLILANSTFTKNHIGLAYHTSSQVCYPGVDSNIFKPKKQKRKPMLLFIGEPAEVTGYNLIEAALALIKDSTRPQLRIVNSFTISDEKLASLYSQSLATVCLSYNEPFGLAVLESFACKTPVIALREGGYKETVRNGKTGFLVTRSPEMIANRIEFLLKSPKRADVMGENGRKDILEHWTWKQHTDCLIQTIKDIMKQ